MPRTIINWISVADRLPTPFEICYVASRGTMLCGPAMIDADGKTWVNIDPGDKRRMIQDIEYWCSVFDLLLEPSPGPAVKASASTGPRDML